MSCPRTTNLLFNSKIAEAHIPLSHIYNNTLAWGRKPHNQEVTSNVGRYCPIERQPNMSFEEYTKSVGLATLSYAQDAIMYVWLDGCIMEDALSIWDARGHLS